MGQSVFFFVIEIVLAFITMIVAPLSRKLSDFLREGTELVCVQQMDDKIFRLTA